MMDQAPACGTERPQENFIILQKKLEKFGVEKYAENFQRAGAGLDLLPVLSNADLEAMGVATIGARKRILLAAVEIKDEQDAVKLRRSTSNPLQLFVNKSDARPPPSGNNVSIFFSKSGPLVATVPTGPSSTAAGGRARAAPRKGWAHAGSTDGNKKRGWGPRAAVVIPFKPWQLVAGTTFVVDRFCNLPASTPALKHWFLTHFHADHYKGLTSKFNRGTIYCTPVTAALVRQQLRVPQAVLREVQIGASIVVEGTKVTFLPANHCPGAVMLLFEPQGRLPVLHSGDCRLTTAMHELPELQAIRGAVDLILDTTYCDPQYTFPPRAEALRFVVDAVKAEAFNPTTLFMFGSYTIGKERLYLQAAKTLGSKVYVSATKKKILDCLGLPSDEAALLTTDDSETNLHAVPLRMISHAAMTNSLKYYRGRFTNVVGFQPTGWTHSSSRDKATAKVGRRRKKGTIITYQVPYSEHSSFSELKAFVEWIQPCSIIPSVNNDGGGPKAKRMVSLLSAKGSEPAAAGM